MHKPLLHSDLCKCSLCKWAAKALWKVCECCGAEFIARRRNMRYCSDKCVKKAYSQTPKSKAQEHRRKQTPKRKAQEHRRKQTPKSKAYHRDYIRKRYANDPEYRENHLAEMSLRGYSASALGD